MGAGIGVAGPRSIGGLIGWVKAECCGCGVGLLTEGVRRVSARAWGGGVAGSTWVGAVAPAAAGAAATIGGSGCASGCRALASVDVWLMVGAVSRLGVGLAAPIWRTASSEFRVAPALCALTEGVAEEGSDGAATVGWTRSALGSVRAGLIGAGGCADIGISAPAGGVALAVGRCVSATGGAGLGVGAGAGLAAGVAGVTCAWTLICEEASAGTLVEAIGASESGSAIACSALNNI